MHVIFSILGILFLFTSSNCLDCDIIPEDIVKPKNRNDVDRYIIYIQGNPKSYTPLQKYNVSLKLNPNKMPQKAFKQFILTLESVDGQTDMQAYRPTGQFDFERNSQIMTRFSDTCENTVVENSKIPKWEIQVYWTAPPEGSGCVALKATVVESRENWFSEDGQLTKVLCEDSEIDENVKPPLVDKCCACSEAKYEMAFEGRWTRNTHPRNYPSNIWSTKFSDIIGASHRKYHSFWNEQDYASEGLKDLAETGRTQRLESEIKVMGNNIRTIIKARGLQHPNITDISYAVFRVDSNNHLVSLVSKITPSPDWFVGVANFELCKSDCTWAESYTYNLYPLDAGTDDGLGYLSSEPLHFSHKVIMPITQNNPNNPQSPFYDEDGNPMNPIAKIHFIRQRLYNNDRSCNPDDDSGDSEDDDCATTKWEDWTPCSVPCGLGQKTRMRHYLKPRKAQDCYVPLVQHQTCQGKAKYCHNRRPQDSEGEEKSEQEKDFNEEGEKVSTEDENGSEGKNSEEKGADEEVHKENELEENETGEEKSEEQKSVEESKGDKRSTEDPDCAVGEWSDWSSCSVTCGRGTKTRDRNLLNSENEEKCEDVEFQENAPCKGDQRKCDDGNEPKCTNSNWGPWSACSVSCGAGFKRRLRLPDENKRKSRKSEEDDKMDEEEENCSTSELVKCYTECTESDKVGESLIVEQGPDGRVRNCKVSDWSIWSRCQVHRRGQSCGKGSKKRSRQILRHPENGGRSCPRKLFQTQTCTVPCKSDEETQNKPASEENPGLKCMMSSWTDFTPCSSICGSSAMQLKTRKILYKPPGAVCPSRVMYKPCNLPLACTSDGRPIFMS
ncbi:unnamed protein product [Psylliodes chrysocephalus]|uniref:Spondin-1 n=1 Tax=Psylliodes chrysocephalus TaxID=3402493 RepID=A0A9P0DBX3_9CUCU|nr:unnamed protein product [Psylliodes chrysocephala]